MGYLPVTIHVRQLIARGSGANTKLQDDWEGKFRTWGASNIDWRAFTPGEFDPDAPVPVEAVPATPQATKSATAAPPAAKPAKPPPAAEAPEIRYSGKTNMKK